MSLGCSLPTTLLFDYPTLASLSEHLCQEVLVWEQAVAPTQSLADEGVEEAMIAEDDLFADSDIRALLDDKLAALDDKLADFEYMLGD